MTKKIFLPTCSTLCFLLSFYLTTTRSIDTRGSARENDALEMFQWWYSQRALPFDYIPIGAYQKAALSAKTKMRRENRIFGTSALPDQWTSIGPTNVAGRILSLAVNPQNTNIVWTGSASGGLWKSTTGGQGVSAWTYVNTGFNVLSVSTIAIDPVNPNNMYIGTGELSFYHTGMEGTPGARSSYGIGILRSTDGGNSWNQTDLTWALPEVTGVQKIIINPSNPHTLFAATSEGVYKSTNAGANWTKVSSRLMAMDIVIDPNDTSALYASHGNLDSTPDSVRGIFKSNDAGNTWRQLSDGLPVTYFGRTALGISSTTPPIIYAGVASRNAANSYLIGLYSSVDTGAIWTEVNTTNYVRDQGWYNNVIAVNPNAPESLYCAGIDIYRSIDSGNTQEWRSDYYALYFGTVAAGGPEGPSWYAHADHHAIVFDPLHTKTIYFGTDGGVFKTTDGGNTFFGCNGGLVTAQFYNGFSNSAYDSTIAYGGLQDNSTLKYQGSVVWTKVAFISDGGWTAINASNQNIVYAEEQRGAIIRSTNGGAGYSSILNGLPPSTDFNFIAPFTISYSNPSVLYAGARNVYKTTDGGDHWLATNSGVNLNGTKLSALAISYSNSDSAFAATGSSASSAPLFQVFATANGGQTWKAETSGLPNRYPTDIEFDPTNSKIVYVTFSGFGAGHLFRTTNFGQSWTNISPGIDIPHQSVTVDPLAPEHIYVGTDLGVYHSSNSGVSWEDFNTGMVPAMVLDVGISRANGVLRAATFGNGVYQRKLVRIPVIIVAAPNGGEAYGGGQAISIQWSEKFIDNVNLEYSLDNGVNWNPIANDIAATALSYNWIVPNSATTQGKIRVSETSSGLPSDMNDAVFTIVQDPDVFSGWNMVSLDMLVPDGQKTVIFPTSSSSAFSFNGTYVPADTIIPGSGYWLKYDVAQHTPHSGDPFQSISIPVKAGWNMIGALSSTIVASSITSNPEGIISSLFFGFNGGYNIADSLVPKYGYWVRVDGDGELILNSSATNEMKFTTTSSLSSFNSITIRDATGGIQSLYYTVNNLNTERYTLPPVPPSGVFDARFSSRRLVEAITPGKEITLPIMLRAAHYPLTVSWKINEPAITNALLRTASQSIPLDEKGSVVLNSSSSEQLQIEIQSTELPPVPSQFTLQQNYPNPFNPTTVIRYQLPVNGHVSLSVYDMVGRKVTMLVDEFQNAGYKSVEFNASMLPTGIYFYRLTAGSHIEAKKMVLMK